MRLVTWNVFHGRSPEDGRVDAERLADAVAGLDADVLALQEVDRGQPRSGMLDVTTLAAAATGAADARFVPTVVGDPAGEWRAATDEDLDVDAFGYGIALVSRHPVRAWHLLRLAPAPLVRAPIPVPGQRRVLWLRDEPRAVLAAELETPTGPLTVACTHLSFVPGVNARQLRRTVRWLRGLPGPRVLLGDLNLPGAAVGRLTGARLLARQATYPPSRPVWQVDHALGDGELPPVVASGAPRQPVSDHAPVVVDLAEPLG
ncbi:endonuclease/exonuclease/phosphatase family protein [Ornithinimicrobium humiphilum]|uniref:Endonuclease/exonuclease/phosphatase family metal-dependent hydrolase n=1 Tax=Ornithinimicrobium humiphilum TaxID=125288 RepID=A0A543K7T8_9MICO|nr:endonuclease/exonuclease/phosphatase family protein [Ornithinimicrobium humiphilum]TQM91104.1 endonuclease/exonuclease/phosphatase family metal-dependent hydrolase [Ornithinimicrobium humiphilum]